MKLCKKSRRSRCQPNQCSLQKMERGKKEKTSKQTSEKKRKIFTKVEAGARVVRVDTTRTRRCEEEKQWLPEKLRAKFRDRKK